MFAVLFAVVFAVLFAVLFRCPVAVLFAARVGAARLVQRARGTMNAEADVDAIALQPEARTLVEQAAEKLRLSARGFTRVLRVARTIADLARVPEVRRIDVGEALAFRHRIPGRVG